MRKKKEIKAEVMFDLSNSPMAKKRTIEEIQSDIDEGKERIVTLKAEIKRLDIQIKFIRIILLVIVPPVVLLTMGLLTYHATQGEFSWAFYHGFWFIINSFIAWDLLHDL